jgi:hypothetical protein
VSLEYYREMEPKTNPRVHAHAFLLFVGWGGGVAQVGCGVDMAVGSEKRGPQEFGQEHMKGFNE